MTGLGARSRGLVAVVAVVATFVAVAALADSAPEHVVIVLDTSADMWLPMRDGVPRLAAAREAILGATLKLPSRDPDRQVAVRLLGADTMWSDDASCSDTRTLQPFGPPDHDALRDALVALAPGGRRPLVAAVLAAIADIPATAQRRRVILVLAGDDDCGADEGIAARALTAGEPPPEIRIVGVAMPHTVASRYAGFAPTRNASTLAELDDAMIWALRDDDAGREPRGELELELTGSALPPGELRVQVVPIGEQEGFFLRALGGGRYRGRADPGRHVLRVADPTGETTLVELGGVSVPSGETSRLRLELPERAAVTLEPLPAAGTPPGLATVAWYGAPEASLAVTATSTGAPIAASLVRRQVTGSVGVVDLPLPDGLRDLEVRLLEVVADGVWRLLGRAELPAAYRLEGLDVPASAETGASLELTWHGEAGPGDRLVLEPAEGEGATACVVAGRQRRLQLPTPATPGAYRVRYLEGMTGRAVASRDITLILIEARLQAPATVVAGDTLEVRWEGPGGEHDYLTVVPAGAPDDDYRQHVRVAPAPPTRLTAPDAPGAWEVRYVEGGSGRVLARQPVAVTGVDVVLEVPARVPADRRFTVRWRGPATEGDLLTVAPVGSLPMRMLDWAPVSMGDPLTLSAPAEPGEYEVRYVSASERRVLATTPVEVVP